MTPSKMPKKKLIEVALPLQAINTASAREKSIRHGHPSTLHLWWARRPLAAARAVIVGDTSYDMEMGRAAGVAGIGVAWGYHGADMLLGAGAVRVIDRFEDLPGALDEIWRTR